MNMPGFTAEASLYRTSRSYRMSADACEGDQSRGLVSLAYHPTSDAKCNECLGDCLWNMLSCAVGVWWPPAMADCVFGSWACAARCSVDACCPKRCVFDPGDLTGGGCCDADEHCVNVDDPNSRSGCCPGDQAVCSGRCCPKGATCCGGECCPAGWFCDNGFCSSSVSFPQTPPPPPPPPSEVNCSVPGSRPCQRLSGEWVCCAPGLKCCAGGCSPTCIN